MHRDSTLLGYRRDNVATMYVDAVAFEIVNGLHYDDILYYCSFPFKFRVKATKPPRGLTCDSFVIKH